MGRICSTRGVIRYMTQATGGLTRRINIVADKALLAAFAENTHNVSRQACASGSATTASSAPLPAIVADVLG